MKKQTRRIQFIIGVLCVLLGIGIIPELIDALQLVIQNDTIIGIHEDTENVSFFDVYQNANQIVKIDNQYAGYVRLYGENPLHTHPEWVVNNEALESIYVHITLNKLWINKDDPNDFILFTAKLTLTNDPEDDPLPITYNWNIALVHSSGEVDNFLAPFVNGEVSLKYTAFDGQSGGMWYLNPLRFDIIPLEFFVVLQAMNEIWAPRLSEYSPYSFGKTAEDYSSYSLGKDIPFGIDPDTYTATSLGKDRRVQLLSPISFSVSRELDTP